MVIVDASLVMKWVVREADSSVAEALLDRWMRDREVVAAPWLLVLEACNSLYQRVRRGVLSSMEAAQLAESFPAMDLLMLDTSELQGEAMRIAVRFGLPATYDAQYLVLASHHRCELWTADRRLWNLTHAEARWVRLLGEEPGAR